MRTRSSLSFLSQRMSQASKIGHGETVGNASSTNIVVRRSGFRRALFLNKETKETGKFHTHGFMASLLQFVDHTWMGRMSMGQPC
jgi:hypothetical protein